MNKEEIIVPVPKDTHLTKTRENYSKMLGDIREETEKYPIRSEEKAIEPYTLNHQDLKYENVKNELLMMESIFCDPQMVKDLWTQKSRLDPLFDSGKGQVYYRVRDNIFPQDRKGSTRFSNRAGDKLWQVLNETNLLGNVPDGSVFLDICGGPGAFSNLLLDRFNFSLGYGMTLNVPMVGKYVWYPDLLLNRGFTALFGPDDSGNVYSPLNLKDVTKELSGQNVHYVVSDGGFKISVDEGNHMENLQEIMSARIILSEVLLMMMTIAEGGSFIVKLFDTFSTFTASIIYVISKIFKDAYIVKPVRSRIVNSERYLVGRYLKPKGEQFYQLKSMLDQVHKDLYEKEKDDNIYIPKSLVPVQVMLDDSKFAQSLREAIEQLCQKQATALKVVMDEVDKES